MKALKKEEIIAHFSTLQANYKILEDKNLVLENKNKSLEKDNKVQREAINILEETFKVLEKQSNLEKIDKSTTETQTDISKLEGASPQVYFWRL